MSASQKSPNADAGAIEPPKPTRRRVWDDAPFGRKVTLLVAAACFWGGAVGIAATHWQAAFWLSVLAVTAVAGLYVIMARAWISAPLERLVMSLEKTTDSAHPSSVQRLSQTRHDELGRISRAVHSLTATASRHHQEANQLRRTLDSRVETATRRATAGLAKMAMRDPLTNLGNRRFLEQMLDELVTSCLKANTDLVCIAIDMDNFKEVNDTLGHSSGDELLRFVGNLVRGSIRDNDVAIRMGGDEFLVLVPGCDMERAHAFADRLIKLFADYARTVLPDNIRVGMSAGIASLLYDRAKDGEDLIAIADRKLYEAKQAGKGQFTGG